MQVPEVGELTKRLTLIIRAGKIVECFYPVFPSNSDAGKVLAFLQESKALGSAAVLRCEGRMLQLRAPSYLEE